MRVTAPCVRLPNWTMVADQLRWQVVHHEVAKILQAFRRGTPAGAGQAGDDDRVERAPHVDRIWSPIRSTGPRESVRALAS